MFVGIGLSLIPGLLMLWEWVACGALGYLCCSNGFENPDFFFFFFLINETLKRFVCLQGSSFNPEFSL